MSKQHPMFLTSFFALLLCIWHIFIQPELAVFSVNKLLGLFVMFAGDSIHTLIKWTFLVPEIVLHMTVTDEVLRLRAAHVVRRHHLSYLARNTFPSLALFFACSSISIKNAKSIFFSVPYICNVERRGFLLDGVESSSLSAVKRCKPEIEPWLANAVTDKDIVG